MLYFLGTWRVKVPALEPKLPKSLFVYKSRTILPSVGELQLAMFWHAKKANLGFKVTLAWPFDFYFVGHLLGFISVGNVSAKIPRFVKLFLKKNGGGGVVDCLLVCFAVLSSVWLNRSHLGVVRKISYPLHKLGVTSGTKDEDPHGRFKREQVKYTNHLLLLFFSFGRWWKANYWLEEKVL